MTDPVARGVERRERWSAYLRAQYREAGPDPRGIVDADKVGQALRWSRDETHRVADELHQRGLLKLRESGPSYRLTTAGMDEAERLISDDRSRPNEVTAVRRQRELRSRLLRHVYDAAGTRTDEAVELSTVGVAFEAAHPDELHWVAGWLADRGLLRWSGVAGVLLTPTAIDVMERAEERPEEPPASGLAPLNAIVIQHSEHVSIVQASPGATQLVAHVKRDESGVAELRALVAEVRERLDEIEADESRELIEGDLAAVDAQASVGRSDSSLIRVALSEIYDLGKQAGASFAGSVAAWLATRGLTT